MTRHYDCFRMGLIVQISYGLYCFVWASLFRLSCSPSYNAHKSDLSSNVESFLPTLPPPTFPLHLLQRLPFFPLRSQSITLLKMIFNVVIHLPFTSLIYSSIPKPNCTLNKKTYSAKKKIYGNEIRRKVSAYHRKSSPRHVFQ